MKLEEKKKISKNRVMCKKRGRDDRDEGIAGLKEE